MARTLRRLPAIGWLLAIVATGGCGSPAPVFVPGPGDEAGAEAAPGDELPANGQDAVDGEPPIDDLAALPDLPPGEEAQLEEAIDEPPNLDAPSDAWTAPDPPAPDPSAPDPVVPDPAPADSALADPGGPPGATAAQVAALAAINAYRDAAGVAPVREATALNRSAQAHADFVVANCASYDKTRLSAHQENASWPGFTGATFTDRMTHFGYAWSGASEVIAFLDDPAAAVDGWVGTVYHRLPLLNPATVDIGYGGAGPGSCSGSQYSNVDVVDVGLSVSGTQAGPSVYPPDGATGMPCSFDGLELPLPPAPPGGYPSGTVVTVQYGFAGTTPQVTGHAFGVDGGAALAHTVLSKTADAAHAVTGDPTMFDGSLALYADRPLAPGTRYRVTMDLVRSGRAVHLDWAFTTGTCR